MTKCNSNGDVPTNASAGLFFLWFSRKKKINQKKIPDRSIEKMRESNGIIKRAFQNRPLLQHYGESCIDTSNPSAATIWRASGRLVASCTRTEYWQRWCRVVGDFWAVLLERSGARMHPFWRNYVSCRDFEARICS